MDSVVLHLPILRPMQQRDLNGVLEIECDTYPFPWTLGNFRDALSAGNSCWVVESRGAPMGYGIMMIGAGEAHLLNLVISRHWQRKGLGSRLLRHLLQVARDYQAEAVYLEVRASNRAANQLYQRTGFQEIGMRRNYYPAESGREDALVMRLVW